MRENQDGFRLDRACIDRIFSLLQGLVHEHMFRTPTIRVLVYVKVAFDPVDRAVLFTCF